VISVVVLQNSMEYIELCVQLYWCTLIYSTGNCVYRWNVVLLYVAQGIGNCVYSSTGVLLYTAEAIGNCVYSSTGVLLYIAQQ